MPTFVRGCILALLSLLLLFAGIDKLAHYTRFVTTLDNNVLTPPASSYMLALFIPLAEIWIAICIIPRATRGKAVLGCSLMLALFAVALAVNHRYHPNMPCGCWFSLTLSEATVPHIFQNILLSFLAFTVWFEGRRPRETDQGGAHHGGVAISGVS